MVYICVDLEASGPVPPLYNMLSIGATAVHREGDSHRLGESLYLELKPIFPGFLDEAMQVCGLDADVLRRDGMDPKEAMVRLTEWSRAQTKRNDKPIFVGHNAVFDWSYINYYYEHFELKNPFGYKGIDTKSLAMGRLGISWMETSKESLEKRLALPKQEADKVHRADYDAYYQALILIALLEWDPAR